MIKTPTLRDVIVNLEALASDVRASLHSFPYGAVELLVRDLELNVSHLKIVECEAEEALLRGEFESGFFDGVNHGAYASDAEAYKRGYILGYELDNLRQEQGARSLNAHSFSALTPPLQHKGGETEADEIEAERFGSIFNFGKPKALVGEGA